MIWIPCTRKIIPFIILMISLTLRPECFRSVVAEKKELGEGSRSCWRGSPLTFSIQPRGRLLALPGIYLSDNSSEATSPRHFTFLYLLSSHTSMTKYQTRSTPLSDPPPCSHLSLVHLGCCLLFGWAELGLFVTPLLKGCCPLFNGTCPVNTPGGNYLVFLGISPVCWRKTCYLLFVFLLFKVKNRSSWRWLSSWEEMRGGATELLEPCSVLWPRPAVFKGLSQGGFKSRITFLFPPVL